MANTKINGSLEVAEAATFNGSVYANSLTIDGGQEITMLKRFETEQDFGTVTGHATVTASFAALGVLAGDFIACTAPLAIDNSLFCEARATAADVIQLSVTNSSNTDASAPLAIYSFIAIQFAT